MPNIVDDWNPHALGPLSEAGVRALHRPSGHYRIGRYEYPVGTTFPGGTRAALCYVLRGACRYRFDEPIDIRAGQVGHLPEGRYSFEVLGDEPAEIILVWELPSEFRQSESGSS